MIRFIHLTNFKCFASASISLANLTLLTGLNGTGKSSVIQGFLLLMQTYYLNPINQQIGNIALPLNGDIVNFVDFKSVLYDYAQKNTFEVCME
ncbi:MAG: AAA family ATPase [Magnetococcales bacterium]|nr:AAA family ATPase [Magnetococcales bacterium]